MISARINSVQSHQSHEVVGFQSAGYLSISFTLLYRLTINKKSTEVNRSLHETSKTRLASGMGCSGEALVALEVSSQKSSPGFATTKP